MIEYHSFYRFGVNLKSLRLKKKLTQSDLAEMIGVSQKYISLWENGKAYPSLINYYCLCFFLSPRDFDLFK